MTWLSRMATRSMRWGAPASPRPPLPTTGEADFGAESALRLATMLVPIATPEARAGDVLALLAGRRYESVAEVAVCEAGRLRGIVRVEELLSAAPGTAVADLMDTDPPCVTPELDRERAAWKAVQHGERSLAVVDEQRRFLGLILPQRLLGVLLAEHAEDMARLGGYLHDAEAARTATSEPLHRRFIHRMPWLLVGLLGAVAAADLVGAFEERLKAHLLIAFFIPGIVYLADAVGTQTEAIIIRGLSLGVSVRQVFVREILTGLLVGATLAAILMPIVWWRWGEADVALAASVGLFFACAIANMVALSLPALFIWFKIDPAFGSGPIATVIQDLLSIVIYFGVATLVVR